MSSVPAKKVEFETPGRDAEETARVLLEVVAEMARESRPHSPASEALSLDSALERELGLDSLGRTELLLRIERAFDVSLPDETRLAETPRELLRSVLAASGSTQPAAAAELRYQAPGMAEAAPARAATLLEVLDWHVQTHPERTHIHVYAEAEQAEEISYGTLKQSAQAVAVGLRERGLQPGQTVAIMLPTSSEYFFSFFGILLAGGIPVPIYPPVRPAQIEEHLRRHSRILDNARAGMLITVPKAKAVARLLQSQLEELRHIVTVAELTAASQEHPSLPPVRAQDIAFLQYTSGSTGDPKGVILTHANLLANIRAMGQRVQARSTDVFVSWLPLYHDMGLIGAWFGSLYYACPLVVMSPLDFLTRPSRWLWAIHRHRGTLSASPNFGYELCLRRLEDRDLEGLDLSSWRLACNGAEPVSPETVVKFSERFSRYGFKAAAMAPVYGLAESSVGLALPPPGRGVVIDRVRRDVFMRSGEAVPAPEGDPNALRFVAGGQPLSGHQIRIVDDSGRELPERREGRLQFQGPSATGGYFRNPEATRRLFDGKWLDSGDRAYIAEGDVYITGRVKDIIIRGGRNIYPHELEEAVGMIAGIRKGCVAVFGSTDPGSETERLVVAAETPETTAERLSELRRQIQDIALSLLGMPVDDIVLVPPHAVLKTSSGKIRRAANRELYERGALGRRSSTLWWQLARVAWTGVSGQARRLWRRGLDALYAAYAWAIFGITAPVVWVSVVMLPRRAWRWAVTRTASRLLTRLAGMRLIVRGLENLPHAQPCVLVANHASYLDSLVLTAAIPKNFSFVAKRELLSRFIPRVFLQRLGTVFVERFDLQHSVEEAKRVVQATRAGCSLAFFPEGTFYRMPGVLPFRMGAFVAAAQAGIPVIPVAIRGTRSALRSESWFPRRERVRVILGAPILPTGSGWQAAVKLRDTAREVILHYSGEPDLAVEIPPT